jgi:hypothetical protein
MTLAPKRRWFRFAFSLRTLFVGVTVFGIVAARVALSIHRSSEQKRVIATVESLGGYVCYNYEKVWRGGHGAFVGPDEPPWAALGMGRYR